MFQGPIHTPEGLIPSLTFPLPSSSPFQDVFARFKAKHGTKWDLLPEKAVFQMNDTHPTIAVAEVMRLLVDIEGLTWEHAWTITTKVRARKKRVVLEGEESGGGTNPYSWHVCL